MMHTLAHTHRHTHVLTRPLQRAEEQREEQEAVLENCILQYVSTCHLLQRNKADEQRLADQAAQPG